MFGSNYSPRKKIIIYKFQKDIKVFESSAFTLLELIVVLAGLGILAGLAIPNFIKYLEFAQIDEAKSLLNAAASECLQLKRNSTSDAWMSDEPEVLKSRKSSTNGEKPLLPGKYEYKDNKKTCAEVQIHDPSREDTIFPMLRFRISSAGKVVKDSQYFNNESKQVCESWGNCGGSESADYLIQCASEENACNKTYDSFGATKADGGPYEVGKRRGLCTWPRANPLPSCETTQVWVVDKKIITTLKEYEDLLIAKEKLRLAKIGEECAKEETRIIASFNPAGEGIVNLPNCGDGTYARYYKNKKLDCNSEASCTTEYNNKIAEERAARCTTEQNRRTTAPFINGLFDKLSDGTPCPAIYLCNGSPNPSKEWYEKDSACKTTTPPPPPPQEKPWYCIHVPGHPNCQ